MEMNQGQGAINSILLASPPGQFDIILDDLRALLPKSSVSALLKSIEANDVRTEWEASTGRSTLVAVAARDDDDDAKQWYIASLSKAMDYYIASNFSSPGVRAGHTVTISSAQTPPRSITINIYAEKIDLHNGKAVSRKGCYTIFIPLSSSSNTLQGNIDISAHTFEHGGNFHLSSNISLHADITTCTASDDSESQSAWASSVVQQIKSWDSGEVMRTITEMFDSLHNTHLKRLRRVMPITRTKMDWNVTGHRVVQNLCEGHGNKR